MRRRRIFTSEKLSLMRVMAEQGCSASEIARTIGSTPGSVKVMCSHHKIRLKRGRRHVYPTQQAADCRIHPMPDHIIRAHMPATLFSDFSRKAEDLQLSASSLASNLLAAIASSRIYEAVLDDDA